MNNQKQTADLERDIYLKCMITRTISLSITNIGKSLNETFEKYLQHNFEGSCIKEGFVKPNSCRLVTYSSGEIDQGIHILFKVVFECLVCFPVEGMLIECTAKNITKAGIRAVSKKETNPSPFVCFIARDHNYENTLFNNVKIDDTFIAKVIGQRFELNDKHISIIGEAAKSYHLKNNNNK